MLCCCCCCLFVDLLVQSRIFHRDEFLVALVQRHEVAQRESDEHNRYQNEYNAQECLQTRPADGRQPAAANCREFLLDVDQARAIVHSRTIAAH